MSTLTLTAKEFRGLVSPVLPMASTDIQLPVLTAVRVQSHDGLITATATDRYRLGIKRIKHAEAKAGTFDALIYTADIRRILAIFKAGRRDHPSISLTADGRDLSVEAASTLGFGFASASVRFTLCDGEYPAVNSLIKSAMESAERVTSASFNPAFLGQIPHDGSHAVTLWLGADPTKPALVASENFIGVIMPRRPMTEASGVTPMPDDWGFLFVDPAAKPAAKKAKRGAA